MFSRHPAPLRCFALPSVLAAACLLLALTASGCRSKIIVPETDTVDDQLRFAVKQYENYIRAPAQGGDRKELAKVAIAAYQKVVDAFPDEKLQVGRARCFGVAWILNDQGEYRKALAIYEDLIENNKFDEVVYVNSMFEAAGIHNRLKRYDKGAEYYRKIKNEYANSPDPTLAELALRSAQLLMKVHSD